jgi:uncharacterized membrane protein
MVIAVSIFVCVGVLLIVLGFPLAQRRIAPNSLYGLRVSATFADEWVWYEANAGSGRDFVVLGAIQVLFAVLLYLAGVSEAVYTVANVVAVLVGTVTLAFVGVRRANRLLAARRSGSAA